MNEPMRRGFLRILLLTAAIASVPSVSTAQEAPAAHRERELLYSSCASGTLRDLTRMVRDRDVQPIAYEDLVRTSDYFVRIAPRKYTLTKSNGVRDDAILGTKPFAFVTTPECVRGRTLLEIYEEIGYEAENIVRDQRDQDMVAIVFRYPDRIAISEVKDGRLPDDWDRHVYVPTWDNVFALFSRLAEGAPIEPETRGEFAPERLFFRTPQQRMFILGFPEEGKRRMRTTPYAELSATKGADWVYRKAMETKLSIFEHFQGNGRTHNELLNPEDLRRDAGLLEFVGPNFKIKDLPEVAVIHLGRLIIEESFRAETLAPEDARK
jgi:hypothetical protein